MPRNCLGCPYVWPFEQSETCLFGLVKILITAVTSLVLVVLLSTFPKLGFGRCRVRTTGTVWVLSLILGSVASLRFGIFRWLLGT